jgi:hypothetical protein
MELSPRTTLKEIVGMAQERYFNTFERKPMDTGYKSFAVNICIHFNFPDFIRDAIYIHYYIIISLDIILSKQAYESLLWIFI